MTHMTLQGSRIFIQTHKKDIALFVLAFCIALLVFALGYIAGRDASPSQIVIQKLVN